MKKSNYEIMRGAIERGYMTEREMNLLKNRSNRENCDLIDYEMMPYEGLKIDPEWAEKGVKWLKSLLKKNGEPRSGQSLGWREVVIIEEAKPEDYTFKGFYNVGRFFPFFVPLYSIGGMEYYYNAGKIKIVG